MDQITTVSKLASECEPLLQARLILLKHPLIARDVGCCPTGLGVQAVHVQKFTLSRPLKGFLSNFSPENCQNGHLDPFIARLYAGFRLDPPVFHAINKVLTRGLAIRTINLTSLVISD